MSSPCDAIIPFGATFERVDRLQERDMPDLLQRPYVAEQYAMLEALADTTQPPRVVHLDVAGLPGSGSPAELMGMAWRALLRHTSSPLPGDWSAHRDRLNPTNRRRDPMADSLYPPATREVAERRKELAPHIHDAFEAFSQAVFAEGALPEKTKQLIAVAVAHTTQCPYCNKGHTRLAHRTGASDEEIMEAIWVAAEMRAGGAYAHSTLALNELAK